MYAHIYEDIRTTGILELIYGCAVIVGIAVCIVVRLIVRYGLDIMKIILTDPLFLAEMLLLCGFLLAGSIVKIRTGRVSQKLERLAEMTPLLFFGFMILELLIIFIAFH